MKLAGIRGFIILLCIALALACAEVEGSNVWFQKRVTWQAGTDPRPWEMAVSNPNGTQHYRLALIPLWAVEGGIVAIEILVARPERPEQNLLGERDDSPEPFVIDVKDLRHGINRSLFGTTRVFNLGQSKMRVKIQGSRLGNGVGSGSTYCKDCENIQELTADFSFESK